MSRARGIYTQSFSRGLLFVPDGHKICPACGGDRVLVADEMFGERIVPCGECDNGHVPVDETEALLEASVDLVSVRMGMQKKSAQCR